MRHHFMLIETASLEKYECSPQQFRHNAEHREHDDIDDRLRPCCARAVTEREHQRADGDAWQHDHEQRISSAAQPG